MYVYWRTECRCGLRPPARTRAVDGRHAGFYISRRLALSRLIIVTRFCSRRVAREKYSVKCTRYVLLSNAALHFIFIIHLPPCIVMKPYWTGLCNMQSDEILHGQCVLWYNSCVVYMSLIVLIMRCIVFTFSTNDDKNHTQSDCEFMVKHCNFVFSC